MTRREQRARLDEGTAYHEAGHFVAHHIRPRAGTVRRISILPSDDSLGHVLPFPMPSFRPDAGDPDLRRVVDIIAVLLAGDVATKLHRGRSNHVGARGDYLAAFELASFVSVDFGRDAGASCRLLIRWVRGIVEGEIRGRWWAVEAVARALLERKVLSGKEAREVVYAAAAKERGKVRRTRGDAGFPPPEKEA